MIKSLKKFGKPHPIRINKGFEKMRKVEMIEIKSHITNQVGYVSSGEYKSFQNDKIIEL